MVRVEPVRDLPDRLTHAQVVDIAAEVWQVESLCRFFTLGLEDAARDVAGTVAVDYPVRVALAIVKVFSNRWNGCPEKGCAGWRLPCGPLRLLGRTLPSKSTTWAGSAAKHARGACASPSDCW